MQLLLQGLVALALLLSMLQERSATQAMLCLILVRLGALRSSSGRTLLLAAICFSILQPGCPALLMHFGWLPYASSVLRFSVMPAG